MAKKQSASSGATFVAEGVEPDTPPTGYIALLVFVLSALVLIACVGVVELVRFSARDEVFRKDLSLTNPVLEEIRARDRKNLNEYQQLDAAKGIYTIPIERAIDIVVADPARIENPAGAAAAVQGAAPATP
ncbi:MAG: hypothetical protein HYV63_00085 [Candidatus Schekmanbacteria bacterium]|nr:hypothetical protein [Candidatus Schekmanbacteria bacterium]